MLFTHYMVLFFVLPSLLLSLSLPLTAFLSSICCTFICPFLVFASFDFSQLHHCLCFTMEQHSEPSTPLRLPLGIRASATPLGPVHLPKTDMLDLLNRQKSPRKTPRPPSLDHKKRSRPTTPHALNALDRLPYVLPKRTPIRRSRLLGNFHRNSTLPAVYDEHYVGPITIEYLRFFTRQLVASRESKQGVDRLDSRKSSSKSLAVETPILARISVPNLLALTPKPLDDARSIPSSASDFNYSLPLPKTDLQLPPQFKEVLDDEISPFIREVAPPAAVKFPKKDVSTGMSYLERILAAQKVVQTKLTIHTSTASQVESKTLESSKNRNNETQNVQDSDFATVNTIHETPQTPDETQWFDETLSKLSPIDLAQLEDDEYRDAPINSSLGRIEVNELGEFDAVDTHFHGFDKTLKEEQDVSDKNYDISDDSHKGGSEIYEVGEKDNDIGAGEDIPLSRQKEPLVNAIVEQDQFEVDLDFDQDFDLLPGSPIKAEDVEHPPIFGDFPETSFIKGQDIFDQGDSKFVTESHVENQGITENATSRRVVDRIKTERNNILQPAKRQKLGEPLPINLIKQLLRSIHGSSNSGPRKTMSTETFQFIQEASEVFLDSLMADLELYSNHRTGGKGSTINALDVLLYFKRTNMLPRGSATTEEDINGITRVAHRFLPLEQLLGLEKLLKRQSRT